MFAGLTVRLAHFWFANCPENGNWKLHKKFYWRIDILNGEADNKFFFKVQSKTLLIPFGLSFWLPTFCFEIIHEATSNKMQTWHRIDTGCVNI